MCPVCREPVLAIRAPGSDAVRLTLTLPALQSAPRICLLLAGEATTRFLDDTPKLFEIKAPRDRANHIIGIHRVCPIAGS